MRHPEIMLKYSGPSRGVRILKNLMDRMVRYISECPPDAEKEGFTRVVRVTPEGTRIWDEDYR